MTQEINDGKFEKRLGIYALIFTTLLMILSYFLFPDDVNREAYFKQEIDKMDCFHLANWLDEERTNPILMKGHFEYAQSVYAKDKCFQ